MMYSLPFLYLPDAVTLILLLIVFRLLRRIAIDHIRQELSIIREEMLLYWLHNALDLKDRGYIALRNLMETSMELVPTLSPARLVFIDRLQRKTTGDLQIYPDPSREASRMIECTANAKGRETLTKLQMEMNMGLGLFFIMGSLSGWFLLTGIVVRILKRTIARHGDHPIDFFFNVFERMLGNIGRHAQQTGCLRQLSTVMSGAPASTGKAC